MDKLKVVELGKATNNGKVRSPESVLLDALEFVRDKEGAFSGSKILIIALDTDNDNYLTSWIQAGMKMSECLALCEVAKTVFLTNLNYIPGELDND